MRVARPYAGCASFRRPCSKIDLAVISGNLDAYPVFFHRFFLLLSVVNIKFHWIGVSITEMSAKIARLHKTVSISILCPEKSECHSSQSIRVAQQATISLFRCCRESVPKLIKWSLCVKTKNMPSTQTDLGAWESRKKKRQKIIIERISQASQLVSIKNIYRLLIRTWCICVRV